MSQDNICYGCMNTKSREPVCPSCGWTESKNVGSAFYLAPGTILINKYLIGKVLGQGGFGITYLAWDKTLDLKLAIKEFFPMGLVARSAGSLTVDTYEGSHKEQFTYGLECFLSEAKTLARFSEHPNIVTVRDFFQANNTAYMVMNYIEGQTLDEYLKQAGGKVIFPKMLDIMMPIMDALREVHKAGFMHRDISPDNIFIRNDSRVVLIDFGAARQDLQSRSRSLSVILKVGYSPEEQYRARGEQGPWTDVYAVAATIYRGITGSTPPEAMDRLADDTLVPPSKLQVHISDEEERVLLKALNIRAGSRFQTIDEFLNALKVGVVHESLGAVLPSPISPKIIIVNEVSPIPNIKEKPNTPLQGENTVKDNNIKPAFWGIKRIMFGLGCVIILAAAVFAFLLSNNEQSLNGIVAIDYNGGTYTGELKDGIPHGQGSYVFANGDKYVGEFKDGRFVYGQGTRTWSNGYKYVGEFKNGIRDGQGTVTWANGDKYVGEFKSSQQHGQGTMTYADGTVLSGKWENDKYYE